MPQEIITSENEGQNNERKMVRFVCPELGMDYADVVKLQHYIRTEMKIGIEFEKYGDWNQAIDNELGVNNTYQRVGKLGIAQSVRDGSIGNGREWLYTGTNESYWSMYSKVKQIHKIFAKYNMKAYETCGMHYHAMTIQQWAMPDTVLKNIFQIVRIFAPGLVYMTKTDNRNHQKQHGANWDQVLKFTPLNKSGRQLRDSMSRYVAVNIGQVGYYNARTSGSSYNQDFVGNDMDGLHIEFRFPDANDIPSAITSYAFLFRAIVDKAIQLSEFGIIEASSMIDDWEEHKSVTMGVSSNQEDEYAIMYSKQNAKALIKFLHGNLKAIDGSCEEVLYALANSNIKTRKQSISGEWKKVAEKIERDIKPKQPRDSTKAKEVRKLIVTGAIEAKTPKEWKEIAEEILGYSVSRSVIHNSLGAEWDGKAGTYVLA